MHSPVSCSALRSASVLLLLALAACGGGDGGVGAPPAPVNAAPVAAFSSADSVVAGSPLALDAGASSDADGDALAYHWDLGDGQRGGGARIAHVYADAGTYSVRLTVDDGRGGNTSVERTITVGAGPAAMGNVLTLAVVREANGTLLAGVTVTHLGGGTAADTGADGRAQIGTDREVPVALKFSKSGYSDQFKSFTVPQQAESNYLEVTMSPREAALTLDDAAAGGTLTGKHGAKVTFAPGTLVDAAGVAVTGPVQIAMTPIDVAANARSFPGRYAGVRTDGQTGLIMSLGTVEYALSQGGAPVHLAAGKKATIEIPIYTLLNRDGSLLKAGDVIPLWSLNERTAGWSEEGSGTVVVADTPSGFALRAEVSHFSWWNCDQFIAPPARPKPRCMVDTNADGILEDLTGTGHCWNAGTGPEQPTPFAPLSAGASNRKQALAEPRTQRIPTFVAEDTTPVGGGKVLPIPGDMDITFRSYAKNGTLFGTKVVRMAANVEEEVVIQLEPVLDNPGTIAIDPLPYENVFLVATTGEVDRYTFAAEANSSYQLIVSRSLGSVLSGSARVSNAAGTTVTSGSFGVAPFSPLVSTTTAGTMSVEVTAGAEAPGSYRIELRKVASVSCATPQPLAIPSSGDHPIGAGASLCFDLALMVDDVVEIRNGQQLGARGTLTLIAPNGEAVATDTYGTGSFDSMLLRTGIAQAGTYRLVVINTASTAGTINGLSVSRPMLAGTLGVPGTASFNPPIAGVDNSRLYLVKPGGAADVAVKLAANGVNQGLVVWPMGTTLATTGSDARIVSPSASILPVVEVFRVAGGGAWDYTLSTSIPATLPLDTDVDLTTPIGDDVLVFRLASAGQPLSFGTSYASSAGINPAPRLYAPGSGAPITPSNQVYTVAAPGIHTLVVGNGAVSTAKPFRLRANALPPPEPIVLGPLVERSGTFALGEVRRYAFDVAQAQVLSLRLSSPGPIDAVAGITGVPVHNGFLTLAAVAGGSISRTLYMQQAGNAVLSVYSPSHDPARVNAPFSVELQAPAPAPVALGAPIAFTATPGVLSAYGYAITAPGQHLLCTSYTGSAGPNNTSRLAAVVWGPSAAVTNYTGDLLGGGQIDESIGALRAVANTLSLANTFTAASPVTARLVALPAPTELAAGAAASNGSVSACERRYFRFAAVQDTAYTIRVTAAFAGSVRVRREATGNGNFTTRGDTVNLGGAPLSLAANVERVLSFTVPAGASFGSGDYVIEVDAEGDAAGAFTLSLTSP